MKLKMVFIYNDFIRFDIMLRQTVCHEEINHQVLEMKNENEVFLVES